MPNISAPLFWAGSALVLSALLTAASIFSARRRKLIDEPGMRRSHSEPTPRGGGIGIVITIIVCGLLLGRVNFSWWLVLPVFGIALVGWIDDHGGLAAGWRFAMHCAVALLTFTLPISALNFGDDSFSWTLFAIGCAVALAVVWSINLHNFMDGINGLLALQAIFVFAVAAELLRLADPTEFPMLPIIWIAAVAGFVPFNFPRARIFMGDVGSGVLGLLVAVAVAFLAMRPQIALASGVVACSAFVTDATCTLLSRIWRGRRWYSAHREHLYQWLVRAGNSHARVVTFYMGWNLLIVLPVICWMNRSMFAVADSGASTAASSGVGAAAAVYVLAVAVWLVGKRRCLGVVRTRGRYASA